MQKNYQLPKEFAEKFIGALRSGNYEQGRSRLHRDGCFCVHGVAMCVSGIPIDIIEKGVYARDIEYVIGGNFSMVKMGLPEQLYQSSLEDELMNLNDSSKKTFAEIADWIEANVEFTESEATHE